jgi:hypothetical protein
MPHARTTDPVTSFLAAMSVKNLTTTQSAIHSLFEQLGAMTDEQLQTHYQRMIRQGDAPYASESGIRSRRAELVQMGKLEDSGAREKMRSGRQAIVWRLV